MATMTIGDEIVQPLVHVSHISPAIFSRRSFVIVLPRSVHARRMLSFVHPVETKSRGARKPRYWILVMFPLL